MVRKRTCGQEETGWVQEEDRMWSVIGPDVVRKRQDVFRNRTGSGQEETGCGQESWLVCGLKEVTAGSVEV